MADPGWPGQAWPEKRRAAVRRLPQLALTLSLAIVLVLPVFAEPTKIKVDGAAIKGYITFLASDVRLL